MLWNGTKLAVSNDSETLLIAEALGEKTDGIFNYYEPHSVGSFFVVLTY